MGREFRRIIIGSALTLLVGAVAEPSSGALKEGMWVEDTNVTNTKAFNSFEVCLYREPVWRYYLENSYEYYEKVRAVIHLHMKPSSLTSTRKPVGDLVFLDDREQLPPDISSTGKGKIILFYPYSQFDLISRSLDAHKSGFIEWYHYYDKAGSDQLAHHIIGRLRF